MADRPATRGDTSDKKLQVLAAEKANQLLLLETKKLDATTQREADERTEKAARTKFEQEMQILTMQARIAADAETARAANEAAAAKAKAKATKEEREREAAQAAQAAADKSKQQDTTQTAAATTATGSATSSTTAPTHDPAMLALFTRLTDTVGGLSQQAAATTTHVRATELTREVTKTAAKLPGGNFALSSTGEDAVKASLADVAYKSGQIKKASSMLKRKLEGQLDKTRAAEDQELYDLLQGAADEGMDLDQQVANTVCSALRGTVAREIRVSKPALHCAMHGVCNHSTEQCFEVRRRIGLGVSSSGASPPCRASANSALQSVHLFFPCSRPDPNSLSILPRSLSFLFSRCRLLLSFLPGILCLNRSIVQSKEQSGAKRSLLETRSGVQNLIV